MGITSFPAMLTQSLTGITSLRLESNNLTAFPAGVYSNLTNLETLYLFDNDAPTIDEAAFANLTALKDLRLQNQVISDGNGGGLPTGVFAGL